MRHANPSPADDRLISLGSGLAPIPERLLIAHARGEVLFICGAGISMASGLPDFRRLVVDVYETLDANVHALLSALPSDACTNCAILDDHLAANQRAEVRRFVSGEYDVVLGMLERRLDQYAGAGSRVRERVREILEDQKARPAKIHRALMRLSDRGGSRTIITTNFDRLLEQASNPRAICHSLGAIPRPTRRTDFEGILHIHGILNRSAAVPSELLLTDQDFGEYYLRRRVVPDLIYDAARLFHLVLVGYSANDPPMRYLLNAVEADASRFDDLKERFTFVGGTSPAPIAHEDWKSRGITPIHYDSTGAHALLATTLDQWSKLSASQNEMKRSEQYLRRIVKKTRAKASETDKDLFDHLFRRANQNERVRLSDFVSSQKAHISWLDAIDAILEEPR